MSTRIALHPDGSLDLRSDAFAPKVLRRSPSAVRVGLVGARALLLAGDDVELEVDVAAGCTLELVEIAATVAYDGRGGTASWSTRAGVRGRFVWDAQPFVVADGARVDRDLSVDLAPGGVLALRETIVWGRSGEAGGALRSRTRVDVAGDPLLVEDLDLRDPAVRASPAVLGDHRVLDTVLVAGTRLAHPDALQLDGCGSVLRGFEHDVLDGVWGAVRRGARGVACGSVVSQDVADGSARDAGDAPRF